MLARSESPAPVQLPSLDHAAVSELAPAPTSSPQPELAPAATAPAASDGDQVMTGAAVDPPSVDTPEAAQRKFARGGHAESDPN